MSTLRRLCGCLAMVVAVTLGLPGEPATAVGPSGPLQVSGSPAVAVGDEPPSSPPAATAQRSRTEESQNTLGVVVGTVLVGGWMVAISLSLLRGRRRLRRSR